MQHNRLLSGICILMSNVWILKQNQFRTIALISFIFMVMITVYGYRISLNMQRILDNFFKCNRDCCYLAHMHDSNPHLLNSRTIGHSCLHCCRCTVRCPNLIPTQQKTHIMTTLYTSTLCSDLSKQF